MNRAERRRAGRGRAMHALPGWWVDVSVRFGEPVADWIGWITSSWEWTTFGVCALCQRRVTVAAVSLPDGGVQEDGDDLALSVMVMYSCGHEVAIAGGCSVGFMPGARELMYACVDAVRRANE